MSQTLCISAYTLFLPLLMLPWWWWQKWSTR